MLTTSSAKRMSTIPTSSPKGIRCADRVPIYKERSIKQEENKMKKIISLALAAALTASLAGCASSDAASTASSTAPATSTAESTADGSASSGDTIKIGVLTDRSSAAAATVTWAEAGAILALEEENEARRTASSSNWSTVIPASDSANVARRLPNWSTKAASLSWDPSPMARLPPVQLGPRRTSSPWSLPAP